MKKKNIVILIVLAMIFIIFGLSEKSINKKTKDNINQQIKYNDEKIPIIMYHSIKYEKNNSVRLPEEKFKEQMKYLKDNKYVTLTLDELLGFMEKNIPIPTKSVVLTFDDGYKDNYEKAYPVLKKYGFKGTLFVISDYIGSGEYLNLNQLKEMDKNGFDIESHTTKHQNLVKYTYKEQYDILLKSKEKLEKLLNKKINYLAYPYGRYDKYSVCAARNAGYKLAVTTHCKLGSKGDGIYTLNRVRVSGYDNLEDFIKKISTKSYFN